MDDDEIPETSGAFEYRGPVLLKSDQNVTEER